MGILSWLTSEGGSQSSSLAATELVKHVQQDIQRADTLATACQERDRLIASLTREVEDLKSQSHAGLATQTTLRAQKAKIEQENRQLRQELAASRKTINRQNNDIQAQTKVVGQVQTAMAQRDAALKATSQQLGAAQSQMSEMGASVRNLTTKYQELEAVRNDLQFEMELLKCTATNKVGGQELVSVESSTNSSPALRRSTSDTAIPPSPYAMVLVDGDGYYWAGQHFAQKRYPSGAHAAHAIKSEVQKHVMSRKLPLHSKIITRVYSNIHCFRTPRYRDQFASQMEEFVESFTESTPLFDYIHAGRGKERVDEKIKENFHLHISDPYCHTIFLALTHDNGFARLLEQHVCDPGARQKIVLVSSGRVASEIARLDLTVVEWPLVFAPQRPDLGDIKKTARHAANRQQIESMSKTLMHAEVAASYISHVKLPELGSPTRPGVLRRHTAALTTPVEVVGGVSEVGLGQGRNVKIDLEGTDVD